MLNRTWKSIRANVLIGLFLLVPIAATLLVFDFLLGFVVSLVPLDRIGRLNQLDPRLLGVLAVLVFLFALYLGGLLTWNVVGRKLYDVCDAILGWIPLVNTIYRSFRQISASIFAQRQTLFKEIVLIEYPRPGVYTLAFVTAETPPQVGAACGWSPKEEGDAMLCLFLPTTPNPISGFFVMMPRSQTFPLNVPVTDVITSVMSAGAVAPGNSITRDHSLLRTLQVWAKAHIDKQPPVKSAMDLPAPSAASRPNPGPDHVA